MTEEGGLERKRGGIRKGREEDESGKRGGGGRNGLKGGRSVDELGKGVGA
jgi:hypothetical protein